MKQTHGPDRPPATKETPPVASEPSAGGLGVELDSPFFQSGFYLSESHPIAQDLTIQHTLSDSTSQIPTLDNPIITAAQRCDQTADDDAWLIAFRAFLATVAATIPADVLAAAMDRQRRFGPRFGDEGGSYEA
jgi:hypothetical protein